LNLPYGIRYEIARLAATLLLGYDGLDMKGIEKLRGLNNSKAVPMIPELFGRVQDAVIDDAFAKEKAAKVAGFLL
jgi:hypothetical protein